MISGYASVVLLVALAVPSAPRPAAGILARLEGAPSVAETTKRIPVILDTDIGDDIDDTWALCSLLGSPEVDLKLVVTDYADTPVKARLVGKILSEVGRTDIPIGIGLRTNENPINQSEWLGDWDFSDYEGTVHEDGVQALIDCIMASPEPVTLLVIGPVPNLPEALRREPRIAEKARIVSMAGSVDIGYGGNPTPQPEWNVVCDVPSYRAVFEAPWEITIAPLDSCGQVVLRDERYALVAGSDNPLARAVIANYDLWANRGGYGPGESSVLFDTVAAWATFDESLARIETIHLSIADDGSTVRDPAGRPVRCIMGWRDYEGFLDWLVGTLTRTAD